MARSLIIPKSENTDQLIDRLDKAILDLIDNPITTQKTASIETLI